MSRAWKRRGTSALVPLFHCVRLSIEFVFIVNGVEKEKTQKDLYVPQHWMELVTSTSRKFFTVQMENDDFLDFHTLAPFFKKSVNGIQSMKWLHFQQDKPFTLFYKKTAASDLEEFNELSMKSTRAGKIPAILLNLLPVPIEKRPPVAELCTSNLPWVFITLRHDGQHDEERANIEEAEQGEGQTEQEEDQIEDHNYDTDDES
ncbi:hypothetical protein J6590_081371 [Homalodisca vitripennis]|nr:hypothetical protein J6590_081371 [Homalodisca vitripennis]